MAAKQTVSVRDRKLSPSSSPLHQSSASHLARPNLKTASSGRVHTSPPGKKAVPNYLKLKAAPSSDSSPRRTSAGTSTITTNTSSATNKTPSARRLAEKVQSPSSPTTLQRSLKPASPMPKLISSSRVNGDKNIQSVRSERISPISKAKSTGFVPVKKTEACAIITAPSQENHSSDHEAAIAIERPVQGQWQSDFEKVVKALNELNHEEEIKSISSLIEEETQLETHKVEEVLKHREKALDPRVLDQTPEQPEVFEKVPRQVGVAAVPVTLEARGDVQKVDAVLTRVEPEVKKSRLGTVVASIVAATPSEKKKDAPRSNDVIKETKSRLMGSRRNRVLALVGAFETVISQQEPEGQVTQKAPVVQPFLQIQEVEHNLEDQTDQQSQQLEVDKNHGQQSQGNGKHQVNGDEEDNVSVKGEEANKPLKNVEEEDVEVLKEENIDEVFEIRKLEEDALFKEEEADKAL